MQASQPLLTVRAAATAPENTKARGSLTDLLQKATKPAHQRAKRGYLHPGDFLRGGRIR